MSTTDPNTIPIPVEGGSMVEPSVRLVDGLWTVCWAMDGGRSPEPIEGLGFEKVNLATRAAKIIRERIHGTEVTW